MKDYKNLDFAVKISEYGDVYLHTNCKLECSIYMR